MMRGAARRKTRVCQVQHVRAAGGRAASQGGITMRRFSTRTLLAAASAALAAVLLIAGGLALWGSAYVHNTVRGQLASQQIFFPPASAFAHAKAGSEIAPSMIP